MSGLSGSILRKAIDLLMVFVLVKAFEAAESPWAIWVKFCALPELSQIGVITLTVLLGAMVISAVRHLLDWGRRTAIGVWKVGVWCRNWRKNQRGGDLMEHTATLSNSPVFRARRATSSTAPNLSCE